MIVTDLTRSLSVQIIKADKDQEEKWSNQAQ